MPFPIPIRFKKRMQSASGNDEVGTRTQDGISAAYNAERYGAELGYVVRFDADAIKSMAIKAVDLADPWALRDLTICVRDFDALPPYARQLVEHMRAGAH